MRIVFFSWLSTVAACASSASSPYAGTLPKDTHLDLTGEFSLTPDGELHLALAKPCTMEYQTKGAALPVTVNCGRTRLDEIQVVVHTSWDQDVPGTWISAASIVFKPDWKVDGFDPLADGARALAVRPWNVSGVQWNPTEADAARILKLIGAATGTETDVVQGGPPPSLEVTAFEVEGQTLRAGEASTLVVRIANHGKGTAYRVVATTRSSIEALHGQRLSFGAIKPGEDKVRSLQVKLPPAEAEHDTMLVLAVSEANGAVPRNISHRFPIAASTAAPALAVQCAVEGNKAGRPELVAGQRLTLRCKVDNTGDADAKQVELELAVANGPPSRSQPQAIAASGHMAFNVPVIVPRSLPIDAPVEIAITARDRATSRSARTTVTGVVRKPKLCEPGQLTRAQYQAKITELRAAVTAGDITQAQLDHYDAELVACLK
jgi:hypothetical protein